MRKFTFLMLLALSACAPYMTPEKQLAADRATCSNYGYKPKTKDFADCMMTLDQTRKLRSIQDQQVSAANMQATGALLGGMGALQQANNPNGVSCVSMGNVTNCR